MKKTLNHTRLFASLLVIFCLLAAPMTAFAKKKGEKNYKQGLNYESAQQWEKAAQEFTLAVAADPSSTEYQLHYRRAVFNASQMYMQQGRALAEQRDYIGAYNAFRQAYGYDPVNELSLSEMASPGATGSFTAHIDMTQGHTPTLLADGHTVRYYVSGSFVAGTVAVAFTGNWQAIVPS